MRWRTAVFLAKAWSYANGKILAGKNGFGRCVDIHLGHAERLRNVGGQADILRSRLFPEERTLRQGRQDKGAKSWPVEVRRVSLERELLMIHHPLMPPISGAW
jgi:hypothetical protein